jgi:hypothetical protein
MGFIKEPKGVDFVINSTPLTDKDRKEISQFIKEYKAKAINANSRKRKSVTTKRKVAL